MKKSGILLALLVAAAFAPGTSQAQTSFGGAPQCETGAACPALAVARRKARKPKSKKQAKPAVKQQEQKKALERIPYTEEDRAAAVIPGMPGVRFWADSLGAFSAALPQEKGPWLILSSGGSARAYGAGVLVGLAGGGQRPDFPLVAGVGLGAVEGPLGFFR